MALGKNLKRKKLIPDDEPPIVKPKPTAKVKSPSTKKPATKSKAKKTTKAKSEPESALEVSQIRDVAERTNNQKAFKDELAKLEDQTIKMVMFEIGQTSLAVEIDKTREVVALQKIAPIPNTPDYFIGITMIRGALIVLFDLFKKFGVKTETEEKPYVLVVESAESTVGFVLDKVPMTISCQASDLQVGSKIFRLAPVQENFIKAILEQDNRIIYLLAVQQLIESDFKLSQITEALTSLKKTEK